MLISLLVVPSTVSTGLPAPIRMLPVPTVSVEPVFGPSTRLSLPVVGPAPNAGPPMGEFPVLGRHRPAGGSDGFHELRRGLVADGAVGALRIVLVSERLAFYLGVGQ